MKFHKFLYGVLVLVVFFLEACGTATIKTEATPELKTGSPLSGIKPCIFLIRRFGNEAGEVVGRYNLGLVKMDKPTNQLFREAITAELRRNGHTVLVDNSGESDIVIDGTVKKYLVDFEKSFLDGKFIGNAAVEITLTTTSGGESISKLYKGTFDCNWLGNASVYKTQWRTCLDETLLSMVKDFSADKDLFDLLKRFERTKYDNRRE